jgi:chaperonin GroEL
MNPKIHKILSFREEARKKLADGVGILADAVTTTLGPKGRNVAIMRQWGLPIVVHDGVTVAREVQSDDPLEAIGIALVREAAAKTNEEAGDGTTTSILLAYELMKGGMQLIKDGMNPMVLRNQIYEALPLILKELKNISKPIKNNEDVARVAFISSANEEIGKLVAQAVEKVGKDGLVTVDEGKGIETEVEYTEGMEFDRGYASPYFVTNPQRMEAVIEKPIIAIVDKKLTLNNEIVPILENMAKYSKDMVIIAEEITGDALATIAANKMKGNINALAVNAPGIGDNKTNYLSDIAVITGGTVISDKTAVDITKDNLWLGKASKVISSRESTVIIGGKGSPKAILERIKELRMQRDSEKSKFEKEKLEERLARISTGIGVIKVGAKTEIDMREKLERVKDAVGAATAAREEGIVPGGGVVFLRMAKVLGESEGERLLKMVLEQPIRKLLYNSGEYEDASDDIVKKVIENKNINYGYEVNSGKMMDLLEGGIIDPAKVIRLSLENAIAVSSSILTTDALIGLEVEEEKRPS